MTSAWPTILNELVKMKTPKRAISRRKIPIIVITAPSGPAMIVRVKPKRGNERRFVSPANRNA
jgi:hypothetical protein